MEMHGHESAHLPGGNVISYSRAIKQLLGSSLCEERLHVLANNWEIMGDNEIGYLIDSAVTILRAAAKKSRLRS